MGRAVGLRAVSGIHINMITKFFYHSFDIVCLLCSCLRRFVALPACNAGTAWRHSFTFNYEYDQINNYLLLLLSTTSSEYYLLLSLYFTTKCVHARVALVSLYFGATGPGSACCRLCQHSRQNRLCSTCMFRCQWMNATTSTSHIPFSDMHINRNTKPTANLSDPVST